MGCQVTEAFARSVIEQTFDAIGFNLGQVIEAHFLGQVLADQPVGILVTATLPGFVGLGEVDVGAQGARHAWVTCELQTVIQRNTEHSRTYLMQSVTHDPRYGTGLAVGQHSHAQESAFAFDQSEYGALSAAADDGIAFPMSQLISGVYGTWTMLDPHPETKSTAAFALFVIVLAPECGAAKLAPQLATSRSILGDEMINPSMTDLQGAFALGAPCDLLWTPLLLEQTADTAPLIRLDPQSTACVTGPVTGQAVGHFTP